METHIAYKIENDESPTKETETKNYQTYNIQNYLRGKNLKLTTEDVMDMDLQLKGGVLPFHKWLIKKLKKKDRDIEKEEKDVTVNTYPIQRTITGY